MSDKSGEKWPQRGEYIANDKRGDVDELTDHHRRLLDFVGASHLWWSPDIFELYRDGVVEIHVHVGVVFGGVGRDALARDAKVAEWIERLRGRGADVFSVAGSIAALYPEAGKP